MPGLPDRFFAPVLARSACRDAGTTSVDAPGAASACRLGSTIQDTRDHVPAAPLASRPAAGVDRVAELAHRRDANREACEVTQSPANLVPRRPAVARQLGFAIRRRRHRAAERTGGRRIWTVITVIAGLLIVTTSLLVGVHLVRDWQQSADSASAGSSSDVACPIGAVAPADPPEFSTGRMRCSTRSGWDSWR